MLEEVALRKMEEARLGDRLTLIFVEHPKSQRMAMLLALLGSRDIFLVITTVTTHAINKIVAENPPLSQRDGQNTQRQ